MLSYQSRFGPEKWLTPYTDEICLNIDNYLEGRRTVVVVPLSFTSDHIETLFEIEELYLPLLRKKNIKALRCPALNNHPSWINAIPAIMQETDRTSNQLLLRT